MHFTHFNKRNCTKTSIANELKVIPYNCMHESRSYEKINFKKFKNPIVKCHVSKKVRHHYQFTIWPIMCSLSHLTRIDKIKFVESIMKETQIHYINSLGWCNLSHLT